MFGEEILNATQLMKRLNISHARLYQLLDMGMPSHRLGKHSRRYYLYDEVQEWLLGSLHDE